MDPLSDVLGLLKPRNLMSAGFDAGGPWSVRFPDQRATIKCGAVVSGTCWVTVEGVAAPVRLDAGASFLLPSGRPFRLASDPVLSPVAAGTMFPLARHGGVVTIQGGGETFLVSSRFALDGAHAAMLLRVLPPIIHLRPQGEEAALRWSVERMMQELRDPQPGSALVIQDLARMMLIEGLRRHLAEAPQGGVGWLFALADRRLGAAIGCLHDAPAHRWTLAELAARAGMSRSTFAQHFREKVGTSPLDYLTRWRMALAAERLARSGDPVSVLAPALGYESESAFSTAFKHVMGCSPRDYGRRAAAREARTR